MVSVDPKIYKVNPPKLTTPSNEGDSLPKEGSDKTLVDGEILKWATAPNWQVEGGIYQNFEPNNVRGETYDVRAGDLLILSETCEENKREWVDLAKEKEIIIEPFRSATLQSFERVKLPPNMYGELWITNALQHKGLAFTGGDIDPGFWGYLYIKIHNVGPIPVSIRYREDVASVRFVRLSEAASKLYTATEILSPSDEQLPPCPTRNLYDWLQLSSKLDDIAASILDVRREVQRDVESTINDVKSTQKHIDLVQERFIEGILAGVVGGAVLALFLLIFKFLGIPIG